jgi:hypothetical protein
MCEIPSLAKELLASQEGLFRGDSTAGFQMKRTKVCERAYNQGS